MIYTIFKQAVQVVPHGASTMLGICAIPVVVLCVQPIYLLCYGAWCCMLCSMLFSHCNPYTSHRFSDWMSAHIILERYKRVPKIIQQSKIVCIAKLPVDLNIKQGSFRFFENTKLL